MKKTLTLILALCLVFALCACGAKTDAPASDAASAGKTVYTIGLCNYVDDASLNQISESIQTRLAELGEENGVTFEVAYDNCNADPSVLEQILANFLVDEVDLMIGVATPVAMSMQAATADNPIPVVFSAVSDPVGVGLVEALDAPGGNLTGTSDYLDTASIMKLILSANPETELVGLLYDVGQDASTTAIAEAKAYLTEQGVAYVEHTGTTVDEIMLAADAMVADGVDAVFTPCDNTVMQAELSIFETLIEAGIPHYTGADSFALNGAFLGYGVDYANLGVETANMAAKLLLEGGDPAETPVMTFDNGTATINTDTCAALGFDYDAITELFAPLCTEIKAIETAESFDEG